MRIISQHQELLQKRIDRIDILFNLVMSILWPILLGLHLLKENAWRLQEK